jgi:alkanesulfonate monooxygenase SsuD/methylene tetrahydromethanopterin reductase-like flavin-dependent oxidoreductase (luciferase family)
MKFGYFTLSDNRFEGNPRTPEAFMHDIITESLHADRIGLNSVWIGEHHFNRRGSIPCPGMMLAAIAREAKRVRLAPAVNVLPMHNPIAVAEEWATLDQLSGGRVDFATGRGYDAVEYAPFGADFQKSAEMFTEGLELLWKCWTETKPFSFSGEYYKCQDIELTPKPVQQPLVPHIACFSPFSMDLAGQYGWHIVFAPFAAQIMFGGLGPAVAEYRAYCAKHGKPHGRAVCSYFIHIADTKAEEEAGADYLMRYFKNSGMRPPSGAPMRTENLPPSMAYYTKIVGWLQEFKREQLNETSFLLGSPEQIIDSLKRVEAAGIDEVVLYFNHGAKPHNVVMEQMDRFMKDIAPAFAKPALAAAQ